MKNNRELCLAAVKQYGYTLEHVSKKLKNDREVVLAAIVSWGNEGALSYASNNLKNDKEFILEAIKQNGFVLDYVSKELRDDIRIQFKL